MRKQWFDNVGGFNETLRTGEDTAGELKASPALTVGPESVDTLSLKLVPSAPARILIAGTLADADMPALFRLADVLVMASTCEGFGLVVLEALACAVNRSGWLEGHVLPEWLGQGVGRHQ